MRRWALRIGLFLLLGAATNVAIAWVSAMTVNPQKYWGGPTGVPGIRAGGRWGVSDQFPYFAWGVFEHSSKTASKVESWWYDPDVMISLNGFWPTTPPEPLVPDWAPFMAPPENPSQGQEHDRILDMRGWPMRSMWSLASYDGPLTNNKTHVITYGIPLPPQTTTIGTPYWRAAMALPLGIRWPGFIVNTLVFAAAWFVVVCSPGWIVRWRRVRRHQCPRCGYPIGVSPVCTECGAELPRRLATDGTEEKLKATDEH